MLKKNFARIHKAPIGSFVEMTPNAYMTNEVWMKIVPHLCDGIRAMEGITNHPDWWIVLSLDGFGSHLVGKSLEEFSKCKILVIKEEGDTSQVSQSYDQLVAKSDKKFLEIRRRLKLPSVVSILLELRPYPVPRSLGTIPRDRGCRDGFPRDNLSKLITNNINNKYIINVHNYINTVYRLGLK